MTRSWPATSTQWPFCTSKSQRSNGPQHHLDGETSQCGNIGHKGEHSSSQRKEPGKGRVFFFVCFHLLVYFSQAIWSSSAESLSRSPYTWMRTPCIPTQYLHQPNAMRLSRYRLPCLCGGGVALPTGTASAPCSRGLCPMAPRRLPQPPSHNSPAHDTFSHHFGTLGNFTRIPKWSR